MVIVGAGVVGAACAYYAARAGLYVAVVEAGTIAGGTTGSGEGNLLVSDKEPGPELDLALASLRLWAELAEDIEADVEYEPKGGVVVAETPDGLAALTKLADSQRSYGVLAEPADGADLAELEPHLAPGLAGGVHYPQDAQVQPMLAAAWLLRRAREEGAQVHTGVRVVGIDRGAGGRVIGVTTSAGRLAADAVVNAAGTWSGEVAALAGVALPIQPRRGFILVTEPLPPLVRHKVYDADYVANVASSSAGLETSTVVEGTRGGTILIGASRERVGFDRTLSVPVLARLAAQAVRLFPFLERVSAIRAYRGFRPYLPDHLPVIGPDPRVEGLFHACGHEGAGVGLAPVTGSLVAAALTGTEPAVDLRAFRADRFDDDSPPRGSLSYEEQQGR
ncbi:Glycine/D-amino acid oxidase [Actinopolymorpha singaporensis]|uniref:Glycine/D-amino acid oxidase n=1 Tax=Actinopolymorpha singaporensis TaxID=117157 RepID=A0A1H1S2P5_9ACTN|nr:Glycine/D-amino acid oxidase [Actinopolymorpha singaporensis]